MEQNHITIETKAEGRPIGDLFGIFFEDLNHAADGGLYAEMVQNRSFEFAEIDNPSYHPLTAWEKVERDGRAEITVLEGDAVSARNPHYLHMDILKPGADVGIRNLGFGKGMCFRQGKKYLFSCYARSAGSAECMVRVTLRDGEDAWLAEERWTVTGQWEKHTAVLEIAGGGGASGAGEPGSLAITVLEGSSIELDFVSLFPEETYLGRRNGLRPDLAEALAELKPKFMRFPGGCLVHDGSLDENARDSLYRWKNTLGTLEDRPARRSNWKYNQTLGLGYYEYFQFCEDIGTKPVPILPAAYDPHHKRMVPLDELDPWIQETLDLIEFANGDETTRWGAVRAALGHREPFGLEYLGIGNEEVGEGFRERFPYFVKAVREKYPDIKLIGSSGPFCAGSEYDLGWKCARENGADIVDEHYYMAPEWFLANVHRYDSFGETTPYVFLGEYASCSNTGKSALAEAAFMTGLQNACHAVKLACYAPLLCHRDYVNWRPDMIWFDNGQVCRSVNYQVQKLFMNHQGDELLGYEIETSLEKKVLADMDARKEGAIYFWGNEARVAFSEIILVDEDAGEEIRYADREVKADKLPVLLTESAPRNFVLKFHAKELDGFKGFRVYFAWKDERNRMGWVLGGWENQDAALIEEVGGKSSFLTQSQFEVVSGHDYELELRVRGNRVEGWIDGELYQWTELQPLEIEPLYLTASRDNGTGEIILKAVNLREEAFETMISLPGTEAQRLTCDTYVLLEENCVESAGFPGVETAEIKHYNEVAGFAGEKREFRRVFPGRSVTVMRLKRE